MNEVRTGIVNPLDSVPWQPKVFEPLLQKGRRRVLSPIVIQRARYLAKWKPSEGLYYCVRFPLRWFPLTYGFDDFREVDHSEFWRKHVASVLGCLWAERTRTDADQLERELYTRQYAFPRGRVEKMSRGAYRILFGEDLPLGISKNTINQCFGLPQTVKWVPDQHETCLAKDHDFIRTRLGITESWPAMDQPCGHVRFTSLQSDWPQGD
jgi:hypothetical protein